MSMFGVWRSNHGGGTDVAFVADGRTVGVDQGDVSATGRKGTPTERPADCPGGDPLGDADRDTLAGPAVGVPPMADGVSPFQYVVQIGTADEDSPAFEGHGD